MSIRTKDPCVDLGFSVTFHKIMGKTIGRLLALFDERASFESVYVALTRVRDATHFRVLQPKSELINLLGLKVRIQVRAFLLGFNDDGFWDQNRATAVLEEDKKLHTGKGKGKGKGKGAKRKTALTSSTSSTSLSSTSSSASSMLSASSSSPLSSSSHASKLQKQSSSPPFEEVAMIDESSEFDALHGNAPSPEPYEDELMPVSTAAQPLEFAGLQNNNLCCYLNSIVVVLCFTPSVARHAFDDADGCWKQLCKLIQGIYSRQQSSLSTRPFQLSCSEWWAFGHQNDVHEFFVHLLDHMSSEINNIFAVSTHDKFTCRQCEAKYENDVEASVVTSLKVMGDCDLSALLVQHFADESPEDYRCRMCGESGTCNREIAFDFFPDVMVFHLSYHIFAENEAILLPCNVILPDDFPLTDSSTHVERRYHLYGIIVHIGSDAGGHYIAYIRNESVRHC